MPILWDAFNESFLFLNGISWGRWWNLIPSRVVIPAVLCPKPGFTWPMHQGFNVICLVTHTRTFIPFPSLPSILFPKPRDILCYIWGASVDQSPPRIKQHAACNPYGYKQGLSLTETRFYAAFSAAYQTWFKGNFWFHKETLFCLPPQFFGRRGRGKKAERKRRTILKKLWREIYYIHAMSFVFYIK